MDALLNSTEFLAAIFGAVVGGVLTAGGGLLVYRRQAVREVRARIYEELIPRLPGGGAEPPTEPVRDAELGHRMHAALDPIERAAHLVGWRDSMQVEKLRRHADRLQAMYGLQTGVDEYGSIVWKDDLEAAPFEVAALEALQATHGYRKWLRRRL